MWKVIFVSTLLPLKVVSLIVWCLRSNISASPHFKQWIVLHWHRPWDECFVVTSKRKIVNRIQDSLLHYYICVNYRSDIRNCIFISFHRAVYTIDATGGFVTELKNTSICGLFKIMIDSNRNKTDLKHLNCVKAIHLFVVDFEKIGLNCWNKNPNRPEIR